jgi:serine/threonine protein kinase
MPSKPNPSASDQHLHEVIAAHLQALDQGQSPDRQELLARHPDLADSLQAFFADHDRMHQAAAAPSPADQPTLGLDSPAAAPALGWVRYFGDYELIEELARGGMGVVYKARQVSLNRMVALKMILAGQLAFTADVQRFHIEASAAGNLDHPNIVPVYEVGKHEGQHYFSMKLIEGGSLAERACDTAKLPEKERQRWAARMLATVARAVHYAHQRGILHRDLKPANILLDSQGQPHFTDFGLAKRVEGGSNLTRSGAIVGTPSYMAPEQASGKKDVSAVADVYSLGAILYELLTGQLPFRATTPLDTILQLLEREPRRPPELKPAIDRDLETICLKCLEKDAKRRYGSAEALAQDLESWQRGEPITARPAQVPEKILKWVRRKPAAATLLATLFLVMVASTVFVFWSLGKKGFNALADSHTFRRHLPPVEEWSYPGAKVFRGSAGRREEEAGQLVKLVGHTTVSVTPDDYNKVAAFYADKLQMGPLDLNKEPNRTSGGRSSEGSSTGLVMTGWFADTIKPGKFDPRPVRVHCLMRRTPSHAVTVFISKSDGEDHTHIILAYDGKMAGAEPEAIEGPHRIPLFPLLVNLSLALLLCVGAALAVRHYFFRRSGGEPKVIQSEESIQSE